MEEAGMSIPAAQLFLASHFIIIDILSLVSIFMDTFGVFVL